MQKALGIQSDAPITQYPQSKFNHVIFLTFFCVISLITSSCNRSTPSGETKLVTDNNGKPDNSGKKDVDPLHKSWKLDDVALVVIDYQQEMYDQIHSETPVPLIDLNTRYLIRSAKAFNIPVVLSEVGVEMGFNHPTVKSITDELPDVKPIDRTSMNAWDDPKFIAAIKATGRHRLVFCGLYTEICLAYPVVDALGAGYDVAFVVDAVGGMTQLAHQTAVDRMTRAGAVPSTTLAMMCEWFLDWKGPYAEKAKVVSGWYGSELAKLNPPKKK